MNGQQTSSRSTIVLTPRLCKAARAMLGWLQTDLATQSGVGVATIRAYESGARDISKLMLVALERAFADAGVEFLPAGLQVHQVQELEAA